MHRLVNGKQIELSDAEAAEVQAKWDLNQAEADEFERLYGYIQKREFEYPPIGDQLDAILKALNYMQLNLETDLVKDLDSIIGKWLAVKAKYPKPE